MTAPGLREALEALLIGADHLDLYYRTAWREKKRLSMDEHSAAEEYREVYARSVKAARAALDADDAELQHDYIPQPPEDTP